MQAATCVLRVYKTATDKSDGGLVRRFDFDIPSEAVADYFYVPPPPVPEIAPPARARSPLSTLLLAAGQPEPETVRIVPPAAAAATPRRSARDIAATIDRLARPIRPRRTAGNMTSVATLVKFFEMFAACYVVVTNAIPLRFDGRSTAYQRSLQPYRPYATPGPQRFSRKPLEIAGSALL